MNFEFQNSFGHGAAHGGVDELLTLNRDVNYEIMVKRREGTIGHSCEKETKRQQGERYAGPGHEIIKSSVSYYFYFS